MVDFPTLTANSNVSRLDIFDSSDFFDFQADVARPEVLRPRRRRDPRLVGDDWKVKWSDDPTLLSKPRPLQFHQDRETWVRIGPRPGFAWEESMNLRWLAALIGVAAVAVTRSCEPLWSE
jgi:hypothetical protein